MTDTTIEAGLFSLDEETRTVRGRLIPWDEPTDPRHKHPAVFRRGTITIPGDLSVLRANRDHQLTDPVAVFTLITDNEGGADVELRIARTPEGDELIAQHKVGAYKRLSAEFRNLVKRGNEVVSGALTGAAFVPEGAFASAALFSLDPIEEATETAPAAPEPQSAAQPTEPQEDDMSAQDVATVPGLPLAPVDTTAAEVFSLMPEREDLFALLNRARNQGDPEARRKLAMIGEANMFALSDVKISGANQLGTAAVQAGWIGHIWEGNAAERVIVPLLAHADLTKLTWNGWKWNAKPTMATWAGNKAALTSGAVTATATSYTADRFAGGHDLAREFYDFNETEAIEAYAAAMVESYAGLSDDYVIDKLIAGGTAVDADTYPTDVPDVLGKIVQGALAVVAAKASPSFAIVSTDLFAEYAYTMRDNTLEFLATSSTLEEGTLAGLKIVPDPTGSLAADQVIVGARRAATVRELPGSPIRVNALDLVNGGVDNAFFAYIGVQIDRPTAIVVVSDAA